MHGELHELDTGFAFVYLALSVFVFILLLKIVPCIHKSLLKSLSGRSDHTNAQGSDIESKWLFQEEMRFRLQE